MTKFEISLSCLPETAVTILKEKTSPAKGLRLFWMGSEPMFWANINNHRAVIWPKGGKDLSAVKMKK
jgi:hypothetical protein